MGVILKYDDNPSMTISKIAVIADFNGVMSEQGIMEKQEGKWIFTCDLKPGEYNYKYLINDCLRLNDPYANVYMPDNKGELWSYLKVNEEGKRLYSTEDYYVNVEDYALSSSVTENALTNNKKSYNLCIDKKIVARFRFDIVTSIHTATVVWVNPKGEIFNWTEEKLFKPEGMNDDSVTLWFWLDLNKDISEGKWTLKLFIDGEYILEDTFNIEMILIYSQNYIR